MMPSKTDLRAAAMSDVGNRLDDELEKATGLAHAAAGAVSALDVAVNDLGKHTIPMVQGQIEAGELSLEQGKMVIDWLTRGINIVKNLRGEAQKNSNRLDGVVDGLKSAVATASRLHTQELGKKGRHDLEIPQSDREPPKKETLKERRLREQAEEETAKKAAHKKKKAKAKKRATKKKAAKKKA